MANSAMEAVGWRSQTHSGRLPKASKAANDEVRQMAALVSHTASKLPPTIQSTAKSTPRAVATPLPPLNRRNTGNMRSEEHTSELQSRLHLVCRLLLEKKKKKQTRLSTAN